MCYLFCLYHLQCWKKFCCRDFNVKAGNFYWKDGTSCTSICVNLCRKGDPCLPNLVNYADTTIFSITVFKFDNFIFCLQFLYVLGCTS